MKAKQDDDLRERINATVAALTAAAKAAGYQMSADGRVGEDNAAALIDYAASSLKKIRNTFGAGPSWYRLPVGPAKISYRLRDLAEFIEKRREEGL